MKVSLALPMPLLQQGGTELLVRELISGLPSDTETLLISQDDPSELEQAGFGGRINDHFRLLSHAHASTCGRQLVEWLKAKNPDVTHFHLSGTYAWNARSWSHCPITQVARTGVPVVTTNHQAMTFFSPGRPPSPTWRKIACTLAYLPGKAFQLHAVRREVCVSKHDLGLSQQSFPGFNGKLMQLYHSRLDANMPPSASVRDTTILNVGTIAFRKGQHILSDAFARIASDFPSWNLQLVGKPAERECVEAIESIRIKHNLQQRIQFLGTHADPTPFYRSAGIYVQPSLLEGLGLSLQEAMFYGVPSVGSTTGGIPELIDSPSHGRLFTNGDSRDLANALAELISDAAGRKQMGAAGRLSILDRGMTRQAMCAAYHKLYQDAMNHHPS